MLFEVISKQTKRRRCFYVWRNMVV